MFNGDVCHDQAKTLCKGNTTFLEAFQKTGRILNITVTPNKSSAPSRVLNYISTPHVTIASATTASCALPGALPARILYEKTADGDIIPFFGLGKYWRDGTIAQDIPQTDLEQSFHVKHSIVSQVNPHITLFFSPKGKAGNPTVSRVGHGWYTCINRRSSGGFIGTSLIRLIRLDMLKWLTFIKEMDLTPTVFGTDLSRIWLQTFKGTATILPPVRGPRDYIHMLSHPTRERMTKFLEQGAQSTWPKLEMVYNRVTVEKCIENCIAMCGVE